MPPVLLICEVLIGMGHLSRILVLAEGLSKRFHVTIVVITRFELQVELPAGIELKTVLSPLPENRIPDSQRVCNELLAIAAELRPVAVLLEYFPFGRHGSIFFLVSFLKKVRAVLPENARVFSSVRDILDRHQNTMKEDSIVRLANDHFDAILWHSDPEIVRAEDSFGSVQDIRIPILYTNYATQPLQAPAGVANRSKTIVVSCGGGRFGEELLYSAALAARDPRLRSYQFRVFGGKLLHATAWQELLSLSSGSAGNVELLQWTPDLHAELRSAAASVSRFGYNTAQDIVASNVPALVIPIQSDTVDEQAVRAAIFEKLGLLRVLPQQKLTPETLATEIFCTLQFKPTQRTLRVDGAAQTCEIVHQWTQGSGDSIRARGVVRYDL